MKKLVTYAAVLAVPVIMMSSCAKDSAPTMTKKAVRNQSGINKFAGDWEYAKGADGTMRSSSDKRSGFESRRFSGAGTDFSGKSYTSASYQKKRWAGDNQRNFGKSWAGNTDAQKYKNSPHYVQRQSGYSGSTAYGSGQGYSTGSYSTGSATERGASISSSGNKGYVSGKSNAAPPQIMHWKEMQRLSQKDTNAMLGRGN